MQRFSTIVSDAGDGTGLSDDDGNSVLGCSIGGEDLLVDLVVLVYSEHLVVGEGR